MTCGTLSISLIHLPLGANLRITHCQEDGSSEPGTSPWVSGQTPHSYFSHLMCRLSLPEAWQ